MYINPDHTEWRMTNAARRVRTTRQSWPVTGCRKTSVFLSRETGISGNFVGRIKGAKCPFDLQFLTWDFP